jgi:hypothetical protein
LKKLLFLFVGISLSLAVDAQKLGFVKRYCLLPYAEIGLGQVNTFATPGYYNSKLDERPAPGVIFSVGLGKQVDDLKFTTSVGLQTFDFSKRIAAKKTYVEGQTASYLPGRLSYESSLFDSANWFNSEFSTQFIYANLALGVEKNYGDHFSFGLIIRNSFLVDYYDVEIMSYRTGSDSFFRYETEWSDELGRSVRGVRRYQAIGELRGAVRVRRQNIKVDLGLNAMLSINSVTSRKPETTYLRHVGAFARFYILPKTF